MESAKIKISTLFVLIIFLFLNISFHMKGVFLNMALHPESEDMLLNYSDYRSLPQKIFDVNTTDWGCYQARELSYLVDYFDYNFIAFCLKHGIVHFFSLSNYIGIFIISLLFVKFCNKYLKLNTFIINSLLLLFLTSSCVILSGGILRSAKIGAATAMMGLLFLVYKRYSGTTGNKIVDYLSIFLVSLTATLFDRQGVYLVLALTLILCLLQNRPGFHRWEVVSILTISIILNFIYNFLIGPWLIFTVNGYDPSFSFQTLGLRTLIKGFPYFFVNGAYLYFWTATYMFGSNNLLFLIIIIFYFIIHPFSKFNITGFRTYIQNNNLLPQKLAAASIFLLIVMNTMMFKKHEALAWVDVQRGYYWIPVNAILLFGSGLIIKDLSSHYKPQLISLVLILLFSSNIFSIPEHHRILYSGHVKKYVSEFQKEIIPMLKNARDVKYEMPTKFQHRSIYRFIERDIRNNPKYRFLPPGNESLRWEYD